MILAGGIFGALIGALVDGSSGALIGALIGGVAGMLLSGAARNRERERQRYMTLQWMRNFFRCLGKLAKSDGHVSEDEVEFVKSLMKEWKLDKEMRQLMIASFNEGRDTSESFETLVIALHRSIPVARSAEKLRFILTMLFYVLVAADRMADPREVEMLKSAGRILGTEKVVNDFFAYTSGGHSAGRSDFIPLEECYKLLEVTPDATDQELKKAYRKKAIAFHPDKVQGAGLSDEKIQEAKEKFQQITNAYDTIRKHRGMK